MPDTEHCVTPADAEFLVRCESHDCDSDFMWFAAEGGFEAYSGSGVDEVTGRCRRVPVPRNNCELARKLHVDMIELLWLVYPVQKNNDSTVAQVCSVFRHTYLPKAMAYEKELAGVYDRLAAKDKIKPLYSGMRKGDHVHILRKTMKKLAERMQWACDKNSGYWLPEVLGLAQKIASERNNACLN